MMAAWRRIAALGAAFALALAFTAAAEEPVWENPDGSPAGQAVPAERPSVATAGDEQGPVAVPAPAFEPTPAAAPDPAPEVVLQPLPEAAPEPAPVVVLQPVPEAAPQPAPAVEPPPVLPELPQPDRKKRRRAKLRIPPGHLPPPGLCRIWFPGRPPGHQPPPGPCEVLEHRVPPGAVIVHG